MNTHCEDYRQLYNELRPHDEIDFYPPTKRYLEAVPISFDDERRLLKPVDDDADLTGQPPDERT